LWAKKAADAGLAKAMYAIGYFLEVGIGTPPNMSECVWICYPFLDTFAQFIVSSAISFYKRAAEIGDKRAIQRLKGPASAPVHQPGGPGSVLHRDGLETMSNSSSGKNPKDKDCVIM
jgi:hypothetical protein